MVAAVAAALLATSLVVPLSQSWITPNVSRTAVLTRIGALAESAGAEKQVKLVSAADFAQAFPGEPPQSGNVWVVQLTRLDICTLSCNGTAWANLVVEDRTASVDQLQGVAPQADDIPAAPVFFDRLKDRATPTWWPLPVAPPWAAWTAIAGLILLAAARRRGFRRPARRLPNLPVSSGVR